MKLYEHLPAAASTMWSDAQRAARLIGHEDVPSLIKKTIDGNLYWYKQFRGPDGSRQQEYIGPDSSPDTKSKLEEVKAKQSAEKQSRLLVDACISLGSPHLTPQHARVMRGIARSGFFAAGGILGGTHAFLAYQNHLGVRWTAGETTMDVDFIAPSGSVLLNRENTEVTAMVHQAILGLGMGFVERQSEGGFYKADEPDFEIDMLTNISRNAPAGSDLTRAPGFDGSFLPLKFMELAFRDPIETFCLSKTQLIPVRLPNPADFAAHKLIVSAERKTKNPTKSKKDLIQAACLITALDESDPQMLEDAFADAVNRGRGWRSRIQESAERLCRMYPEIEETVQRLVSDPGGEIPSRQRG